MGVTGKLHICLPTDMQMYGHYNSLKLKTGSTYYQSSDIEGKGNLPETAGAHNK